MGLRRGRRAVRVLTLPQRARASAFAALDFRSKLLMMGVVGVVAFVWESPLLGGLLTLAMALLCWRAGVPPRYMRAVVALMAPFFAMMIVTQGFFGAPIVAARLGEAELTALFRLPEGWWLVGGAALWLEGVLYALNVIFKTLTLTFVVLLGTLTTDVNAMVVGLVKVGLPYKLAFIFSAALRFFPMLLAEAEAIIEAQRLRGLALGEMGPIRRATVYAKIAVPLILGALVRAQTLEVVLQAKAFSGRPDRTYLHPSRLTRRDVVALAVSAALFAAAAVAYLAWDVGRFGGPLSVDLLR